MTRKRHVIFHVDPQSREYYVFDRQDCTVKAGPMPVVQAIQERDRLNALEQAGREGGE